jgi:hypothetical protein
MLQTINGFDLMLIIIITGLLINVYRLNRECESYVEQVLRLSWDLQAEIQDNVMWKAKYEYDSDLAEPAFTPASDDYRCTCDFCSDLNPWLWECKAFEQAPPF